MADVRDADERADHRTGPSTTRTSRRVVLLGASNLTRGLSIAVETARRYCGAPLEILAALGHGRSYGIPSTLLGRELPGITECGLWAKLDSLPPADTVALITDIGNDLLYGVPVQQVVDWVDRCLERLAAAGARTVVTGLPIEPLTQLTPARFFIMRALLFPASRLTLDQALRLAATLHQQVVELANERQLDVVFPDSNWFGFDPIHIRRRQGAVAWGEILRPWIVAQPHQTTANRSSRQSLALRRLRPERYRILGRDQHRPQPSRRFPDGTTIALY